MSASFAGNPNSFLAEEYIIPPLGEERNARLREYFNSLSSAVNRRDIGIYVTQETVCGQVWLPTANTALTSGASTNLVYRQVIRKVVETGTVTTGANAVAHNVAVTATTHFTRVYGVIENPGTLYVPVPNDTVLVTVDATNINLTIPVAYNNFTGQVVLEWVATD